MNKIESYLDQVCKGLGGSNDLVRHLRDELRGDLLESVERHKAVGKSEPDAIAKTIEEFGEPTLIHDGLESIYGHRTHLSVLIEKAMLWRERTMKTGLKWNFVGMSALMLIVALQALYFLFIGSKLIPKIIDIISHNDSLQFSPMISIAHLYGFILYNDWFLWLFLAIITVGWIYFERQAQIVNKSVIRFATGALIALSLSVANIIISGLVIIWLVVMVSNLLI